MSLDWTEIQKDSYGIKYFKKVDNLDDFKEIVGKTRDAFLPIKATWKGCILNISFHFETSLIYIYVCHETDCQEDVGVQVVLQLLPFMNYFNGVKVQYNNDASFNKFITAELILKYKALFDQSTIAQLLELGLEIYFFNYGWDCESGTVTYQNN